MKHLPNALTLLRLALAPVVAWLMLDVFTLREAESLFPDTQVRITNMAATITLAASLFVIAALTDLLDGMIARAFNAHSKFGRIIDPIADKALVGLPLVVIASLAWNSASRGDLAAAAVIVACAVIVLRDITMTLIRIAAPDGEGARVSPLAKWKTALELMVVGSFLVALAVVFQMSVSKAGADLLFSAWPLLMLMGYGWIALLVFTAALSAWTAWQYLRPAKSVA